MSLILTIVVILNLACAVVAEISCLVVPHWRVVRAVWALVHAALFGFTLCLLIFHVTSPSLSCTPSAPPHSSPDHP